MTVLKNWIYCPIGSIGRFSSLDLIISLFAAFHIAKKMDMGRFGRLCFLGLYRVILQDASDGSDSSGFVFLTTLLMI